MPGEDIKLGRPSTFTQDLADSICERMACGESMRAISETEGFPDKRTILRWLATNEAFCTQYAHARAMGMEAHAEEIIEIADDGRNDWMERLGLPGWESNGEHINRSRLRVDARKWIMSKLAPKKYGDKVQQEVSGPHGGPIQTQTVKVEFVEAYEITSPTDRT